MLAFIQHLFKTTGRHDDTTAAGAIDIRTATCGILLEMAHVDDDFSPAEEQWIFETLEQAYGLTEEEMRQLKEQADRVRKEQVDLYEFSKVIKEQYDYKQKCNLLQMIWQVVLADNRIDEYEDELVRRVTYLVGLDHKDMIDAKVKVLKSKGGSHAIG